ncbi:MAG: hypothetical protein ACJ786_23900 [Catenulispora sp.]
MTRIVSDGVHVVRATGQRVLDGVGAAAEEVRHEAHKAREHLPGNGKSGKLGKLSRSAKSAKARIGKPGQQSRSGMMRSRTAELVASTAGAIAAFVVTALVRGRRRDQHK